MALLRQCLMQKLAYSPLINIKQRQQQWTAVQNKCEQYFSVETISLVQAIIYCHYNSTAVPLSCTHTIEKKWNVFLLFSICVKWKFKCSNKNLNSKCLMIFNFHISKAITLKCFYRRWVQRLTQVNSISGHTQNNNSRRNSNDSKYRNILFVCWRWIAQLLCFVSP